MCEHDINDRRHYKNRMDLVSKFDWLHREFPPPPNCSNSLTFDSESNSLRLTIWYENNMYDFGIEQDEMLFMNTLVDNIKKLLAESTTLVA